MKFPKWIIAVVILGILILWGVSKYNGLVQSDQVVKTKWANVEATYQRRADLIPNLVQVVKGYATHERETLEAVTKARSQATSTNIDASQLDEAGLKAFQQRQDALSSALSRLLVVVEKYPELKANEQFRDLQAQLEGTENRINVARQDYNEATSSYNTQRAQFPTVIVAGITGFRERPFFQAQAGSEVAPSIDFSTK